jgi:tetratricopeptide (TPR) repeat protein
MKLAGFVLSALLVASPAVARAQTEKVAESKEYFKAGAAAYAAGDYLAAIQALEAAYALTPLPAIGFSLAQAERKQYFVSRDPAHVERAIRLFRDYLAQVSSGGRRVDATDALAQLEPLALSLGGAVGGAPGSALREPPKTRLMVSAEAPRATISLDGRPPVRSPLIVEVEPGPHAVRVASPGFFPSERRVTAVQGALVPVEVELRERPSILVLRAPEDADLYVDGSFVGQVRESRRLELPSGRHVFNLALKGRRIETRRLTLGRGETRELRVVMRPTGQRLAARSLFVTTAAGVGAGMLLTALAIREENVAEQIDGKREASNISASQLDTYKDSLEMRNRFRIGAVASYAVAFSALVTGVVLHEFDSPGIQAASRVREGKRFSEPRPRFEVGAGPDGAAGSLRFEF